MIAGLVATIVLSAIMLMKSAMGLMPQLNVIQMLNQMAGTPNMPVVGWVMRGDLERAPRIINAALAYANDLGLFAEEADPRTGNLLGNLPQAFVHAAFIGAVIDLKAASASRT